MTKFPESIINLVQICHYKGIENIVLSPGSRCAPLTLSFVRHPEIKTYTITDERSAGYFALGLAQQTGKPVGLVCTSGTATLNYAPAITEAFYQNIPLIVFTADRPPEWIDQYDNQSIHQTNIYAPHCQGSFLLPIDNNSHDSRWHSNRIISEAINKAVFPTPGPVHINVPLREPLYPDNESFDFSQPVKVIFQSPINPTLPESEWEYLIDIWNKSKRKVILSGLNNPDMDLNETLARLIKDKNDRVIISDITGNLDVVEKIYFSDAVAGSEDESIQTELAPDLLITFGGQIVSKYIKMLLRKYPPTEHWHIQSGGIVGDTYQALTRIIPVKADYFFSEVNQRENFRLQKNTYTALWHKKNNQVKAAIETFLTQEKSFNEFSVMYYLIKHLPESSKLQLGNSMPIRYANFISLYRKNGIKVNSNRGTSGIDGTLSTTVGASQTTSEITTLITGDLAFFYDRNGLWNRYINPNLRIIILNNHGGGIFRILEGSSRQPELNEYFETINSHNAELTAKEAGIEYQRINNYEQLEKSLKSFFIKDQKAKLMEIETDSKTNTLFFSEFKKMVKNLK